MTVTMLQPGYVPSGGGRLDLDVGPGRRLLPVCADHAGPVRRLWGIALASHLQERHVSRRLAGGAVLAEAGYTVDVEEREDSTAVQPGAGLAPFADLDNGFRLGADGAGAPGRRAEAIGAATARRLLEDLDPAGWARTHHRRTWPVTGGLL